MIIRKRQLLFAALAVVLGAAVFINWYYTKPGVMESGGSVPATAVEAVPGANLGDAKFVLSSGVTVADESESGKEFFDGAKLKRSNSHDEAAKALNEAIKNASNAKASANAAAELSELAENMKLETDIENLITAKLGCECLVVINEAKADIVVEKGALSDVAAVQIREIVVTSGACTADRVNISENN